jgi:SPP1 gp7 family putative phage head morphogenesis protein
MNEHVRLDALFDRKAPSRATLFARARKLDSRYGAQLRRIAKQIADIIRGFDATDFAGAVFLRDALTRYSKAVEPWAQAAAATMITEVAARDKSAWSQASADMGRALRKEIESAPTGEVMRKLLGEQVTLITSLPTEAAERVHSLALEGMLHGTRSKELAAKILETGQVTEGRARTIARTEVARVQSVLTQVRAQHVGCTHFIWRTAKDVNVRPSHRALEGQIYSWDAPPICDPPDHRALPGQIWNCRCIAEPIIPDED